MLRTSGFEQHAQGFQKLIQHDGVDRDLSTGRMEGRGFRNPTVRVRQKLSRRRRVCHTHGFQQAPDSRVLRTVEQGMLSGLRTERS